MADFPPDKSFLCSLEGKETKFMALFDLGGGAWKWKCKSCGEYKIQ